MFPMMHLELGLPVAPVKMAALTTDTINPGFKRIRYEVRGPLVVRAREIEQELARVRTVFFIKLILYNGWARAKQSVSSDYYVRFSMKCISVDLLQKELPNVYIRSTTTFKTFTFQLKV